MGALRLILRFAYSLIFIIGLRFVTPYTTNAKVIQHTIQLVPRLPEPTLVTAVLVEPDVPVKKGQPLFQFDRRPYEYKVRQLEAQLAQAKQNVKVMKADTEATAQKVVKLKSELSYSAYQQKLSTGLSRQGAGPEEDAQKWTAKVAADKAAIKEAEAELLRAQLNYESQIDGVNTKVAAIQAELDQARYYLDNTLMVAPETCAQGKPRAASEKTSQRLAAVGGRKPHGGGGPDPYVLTLDDSLLWFAR